MGLVILLLIPGGRKCVYFRGQVAASVTWKVVVTVSVQTEKEQQVDGIQLDDSGFMESKLG